MPSIARQLTLCCFVTLMLPLTAAAASISVQVRTPRGAGVGDAVIWAVPVGRAVPPPTTTAVMDQKDRIFVPHVLPVQTGTPVSFPNSDNVRHHVYSFSPAKTFQLPLYKGNPPHPVVFDKPGVVTIGCNIHDRMTAYIVIVDTPHFVKTAGSGAALMNGLPAGRYVVRMWYPELRGEPESRTIELGGASDRQNAIFVASRRAATPIGP